MAIDVSKYKVVPVPMNKVFKDDAFNCRGSFSRAACMDLAKDIKDNGLEFPIHVQPWVGKPGFEYRIISGHRRFTAYQINGETEVPAVVRTDLQDEVEARAANLRENIQRADLNILQEAEAVSWYITQGFSVAATGTKIGKSTGWVEVRRKLLHLPDSVRQAAEKGVVNQGHIHQLWEARGNPDRLAAILRTIKERKEAGEKAIVVKEDVTIQDFAKARRPKPHEIAEFLNVLSTNITMKLDQPEYFPARVLAWAAGNISPAELYASLRRECEAHGLPFNPPADVKKIFDGIKKV